MRSGTRAVLISAKRIDLYQVLRISSNYSVSHLPVMCRCKVTADLTLNGKAACVAQCEKCSARISAAFRPSMLHHYSDVLGYLDLQNAVPTDLVLQDCHLIVGCLSCSQESFVQVHTNPTAMSSIPLPKTLD